MFLAGIHPWHVDNHQSANFDRCCYFLHFHVAQETKQTGRRGQETGLGRCGRFQIRTMITLEEEDTVFGWSCRKIGYYSRPQDVYPRMKAKEHVGLSFARDIRPQALTES